MPQPAKITEADVLVALALHVARGDCPFTVTPHAIRKLLGCGNVKKIEEHLDALRHLFVPYKATHLGMSISAGLELLNVVGQVFDKHQKYAERHSLYEAHELRERVAALSEELAARDETEEDSAQAAELTPLQEQLYHLTAEVKALRRAHKPARRRTRISAPSPVSKKGKRSNGGSWW